MKKTNYLLVDAEVLPEVFLRVIKAKRLFASGEARTVNDAAKAAGVSRSAFYKYKDAVFLFNEMRGIITLFFEVIDSRGVLSGILSLLAGLGANVLTINQNIPMNGVAGITITLQADAMSAKVEDMTKALRALGGVKRIEVLGSA